MADSEVGSPQPDAISSLQEDNGTAGNEGHYERQEGEAEATEPLQQQGDAEASGLEPAAGGDENDQQQSQEYSFDQEPLSYTGGEGEMGNASAVPASMPPSTSTGPENDEPSPADNGQPSTAPDAGTSTGSRSTTPQQTILQQVANMPSPVGTPRQPDPDGTTGSRAGSANGSQWQEQQAASQQQQLGEAGQDDASAGQGQGQPIMAGPRYQHGTLVLPKPPLQDYTNEPVQHIAAVFGPASFQGIRSLPNALTPDFRLRLYDDLVQTGQLDRQGLLPSSQPRGGLSYSPDGGPGAVPVPLAVGLRPVAKVHPHAGTFTSFEYLPSEYDRERMLSKFDKLKGKLAQVTPVDFVVKATPAAPKGAPAFSEYEYVADPYYQVDYARKADDEWARSRQLSGAFMAGGRLHAATRLKGLLDECMQATCRLLSTDWPTSFLQVFEDQSGAIVISFDKARAVAEGDLSAYMNHLAKSHWLVGQFALAKDSAQWGLVDDDTQSVFYIFWPPWVRHKYVPPEPPGAEGGAGSATAATTLHQQQQGLAVGAGR